MKTKNTLFLIILMILFVMACSKEDNNSDGENPQQLDAISGLFAIDAGNNSGSEDIYIKIIRNQSVQINRIRVMLVPSSESSTFTAEQAEVLTTERYQDFTNVSANTYHLSPNIHDVNGALMELNQSYTIRIATYSNNEISLSNFNRVITLTNQNPLAGRYTGTWNDNIYTDFGVSMVLSETSNNATINGTFYYSDTFSPCCQNPENDGTVTFSNIDLETNSIGDFIYNQVLANFMNGQCNGTYTGTNGDINGLTINIGFTGNDCEGPHTNGQLMMTRIIE